MKTRKIAIQTMIFFFILLISLPAYSATLFFEDFESDLSNWFGQNEGAHYGIIVDDPDPNQSDHTVAFTHTNWAGDIFTKKTFESLTGNYILSFEYFRLNDAGTGAVGFSYGTPGGHTWLFGNPPIDSPIGEWKYFKREFKELNPIRVMLEDFYKKTVSQEFAGDTFFDNILLTDEHGPDHHAPVPEPTTLALLGTGLIGMVLYGRKKKMLTN